MRFRFSLLAIFAVLLTLSVSAASFLHPAEAGAKPVGVLRWQNTPIKIAFSASLFETAPNIKQGSDPAAALRRSLATWERAANIRFIEISSEKLSASPAGRSGDGVSLITVAGTAENVALFSKDPDEVAAATRVFYDRKGAITEADIVLNPYQQFSGDGTFGTFDLESTFTHEIGHLLGLDHSDLVSSAMYENYGQNGVYGSENFTARKLAASDLAAIRAKYGVAGDEECCGAVTGKLPLAAKYSKSFSVWAEDAVTGAVHAQAAVAAGGAFRLEGLPAGNYRILAQTALYSRNPASVVELGEVSVVPGSSVGLSKRVQLTSVGVDLQHVGLNGEIAGLPVAADRGKTFTIYLAGNGLTGRGIKFGSTSPFITVLPETVAARDYGDDITVVSLDVRISADAPPGEYSLFAAKDEAVSILPAAISIGRDRQ